MNAGRNKQFLQIRSLPLIIRTLQVFQKDEACHQIIVVANFDEIEDMKQLFAHYEVTKVQAVVSGGRERQESVYAGLQEINHDEGVVLVHDGARPFVRQEEIHQLINKVSANAGAVLAARVKDTIKKGSADQIVTETLMRDELWSVQTPQAFPVELLKRAHEGARTSEFLGTDDASLVEHIGGHIHLVPGSEENIKLTTPYDISIAEMILEGRKEDQHENRARL